MYILIYIYTYIYIYRCKFQKNHFCNVQKLDDFVDKHNIEIDLTHVGHCLFHAPYAKLVQKSMARLAFNDFKRFGDRPEFKDLQKFADMPYDVS